MRLHSHMWVSAFLKKVNNNGASAVLLRRGEETAGAIYVKVAKLDKTAYLYSPAPFFMFEEALQAKNSHGPLEIDRCWHSEFGATPQAEFDVDEFLRQQIDYDKDIWVIEVEDPQGRHFLDDQLIDTKLD